MIHLFRYNWQVRDEWLQLCEEIPQEELTRTRTGGPGSILYTLYHVVDVEISWLADMQGKQEIQECFERYSSIQQIRELSNGSRPEIEAFLASWRSEYDWTPFSVAWSDKPFTKGEVLRHLIAHEIHHMGQLSIWARELGREPVSANVIGRGLF